MTWRHLMRGGLRQIWRYRLRSLLVICCAALGVAGAVTSVNYASGGREQVLTRIQQLGTNLLGMSFLSRVKWTHDKGRLVLEQ